MTYIKSDPTQGAAGARKYTGQVATGYDAKRTDSPKWKAEQSIIEGIIADYAGCTLLDVPVGTGRFIPAYERHGIKWTGVDISTDMLDQSSIKMTKPELARLMTGNVTALPFGDNEFDVSTSIRNSNSFMLSFMTCLHLTLVSA
jgi:ubiquinone/menaquinone biosynthesis C-methylase UbiE